MSNDMSGQSSVQGHTANPSPSGIRPATRDLINGIVFDVWPKSGTRGDYGLDSQQHYEAVSAGYRHGDFSAKTLDAAYRDGDKLTELMRSAPSNPHKDIEFHTAWDGHQPEANISPLPSPSEIAERGPVEPAVTRAALNTPSVEVAMDTPNLSPSEIAEREAVRPGVVLNQYVQGPVVDIAPERSGQLSPSHTPGRR